MKMLIFYKADKFFQPFLCVEGIKIDVNLNISFRHILSYERTSPAFSKIIYSVVTDQAQYPSFFLYVWYPTVETEVAEWPSQTRHPHWGSEVPTSGPGGPKVPATGTGGLR